VHCFKIYTYLSRSYIEVFGRMQMHDAKAGTQVSVPVDAYFGRSYRGSLENFALLLHTLNQEPSYLSLLSVMDLNFQFSVSILTKPWNVVSECQGLQKQSSNLA
jgi:hypothetical protein